MTTHEQEVADAYEERKSTRKNLILAVCAVAGLGVLLATSVAFNQMAGILRLAEQPEALPNIPRYVVPIVSIIGLTIWKLEPSRSWPWLLVAGVVGSTLMISALFTESGSVAFLPVSTQTTLILTSPVLVLIAVVGAGAWLSTQGMHRGGAVLVGASIVIQLVGAVTGNILFLGPFWEVMRWVSVLLVALGLVGGIVAVTRTRDASSLGGPQPIWRVTAAGSLGVLTSLLPGFMGMGMTPSPDFDYLGLGALILGIAVVIGLVAGWRALLSSLVLGSINAVIVILLLPTVQGLRHLDGLAVGLLLLALVLGVVAGYSPARSWLAITGLTVVGVSFFLMMSLDPSSESYDQAWEIVTPILVVLTVVATYAAISTMGRVLARRGEAPAVLIGLTTPFQLAGLLFFLDLQLNVEFEGPTIDSILMPSGLALLLAAVTLSILVTRTKDSEGAGSSYGEAASSINETGTPL